jgi:hypothetical protein
MKNKYRVAVCISGEIRYWEIQQYLFNEFHDFRDNVEFDFFISAWDTDNREEYSDNYPYRFHGNSMPKSEIIDSLKNLKIYEFLGEEIEDEFIYNSPKNWYLIYRCNLLKTEYELKNDFVYDCVFISRPDALWVESTIPTLYKFLLECSKPIEYDKSLGELYILNSNIYPHQSYGGFGTADIGAMGTSATMDIYCSLYKYVYMSNEYNMLPMGHSLIPFYMKYIGLNMSEIELGNTPPYPVINRIRKPKTYEKLLKEIKEKYSD